MPRPAASAISVRSGAATDWEANVARPYPPLDPQEINHAAPTVVRWSDREWPLLTKLGWILALTDCGPCHD